MFGLTRREQRWKAEQKAAEALVPFAVAAVQAAAQVRAAEAQTDAAELARLRAAEADFHMEYRLKCDVENKAQAQEIERLRTALARVERWHGEFPETGRFWDEPENTRPMSYSSCYGSNGERDFMRQVARDALGPSVRAKLSANGVARLMASVTCRWRSA